MLAPCWWWRGEVAPRLRSGRRRCDLLLEVSWLGRLFELRWLVVTLLSSLFDLRLVVNLLRRWGLLEEGRLSGSDRRCDTRREPTRTRHCWNARHDPALGVITHVEDRAAQRSTGDRGDGGCHIGVRDDCTSRDDAAGGEGSNGGYESVSRSNNGDDGGRGRVGVSDDGTSRDDAAS